MRLLIVEDDPVAAEVLAKGLREHAHAIIEHQTERPARMVDDMFTLARVATFRCHVRHA